MKNEGLRIEGTDGVGIRTNKVAAEHQSFRRPGQLYKIELEGCRAAVMATDEPVVSDQKT